MPNKCKIYDNNDGHENKDHYTLDLDQEHFNSGYFSEKFVTAPTNGCCKHSASIITGQLGQQLSSNLDIDYDSTGTKQQTDESSPDEDELVGVGCKNSSIHKSNHIKSCPLDFKATNRIRGILKYPPGWPKRAFSESDARQHEYHHSQSSSDDYGYFGTSLESPEILLDCFEYESCSIEDLNKPKKCVTISDKIATYVFRPNSSILGRRQKNQKKAQKKKERELKKLSCSPPNDDDDDCHSYLNKRTNDEIEAVKNAIEWQRNGGIPSSSSSYDDSSYSSTDASSSSGCSDTSASDCSADETNPDDEVEERLNTYEEECNNKNGTNSKSKRKNRRKRNRKNKLSMKTFIETGGYDSD